MIQWTVSCLLMISFIHLKSCLPFSFSIHVKSPRPELENCFHWHHSLPPHFQDQDLDWQVVMLYRCGRITPVQIANDFPLLKHHKAISSLKTILWQSFTNVKSIHTISLVYSSKKKELSCVTTTIIVTTKPQNTKHLRACVCVWVCERERRKKDEGEREKSPMVQWKKV